MKETRKGIDWNLIRRCMVYRLNILTGQVARMNEGDPNRTVLDKERTEIIHELTEIDRTLRLAQKALDAARRTEL